MIIHTFEQAVDRNQTFERLEEKMFVAHDQVIALDKRQPQVASQVGVFKISFVIGPGG